MIFKYNKLISSVHLKNIDSSKKNKFIFKIIPKNQTLCINFKVLAHCFKTLIFTHFHAFDFIIL